MNNVQERIEGLAELNSVLDEYIATNLINEVLSGKSIEEALVETQMAVTLGGTEAVLRGWDLGIPEKSVIGVINNSVKSKNTPDEYGQGSQVIILLNFTATNKQIDEIQKKVQDFNGGKMRDREETRLHFNPLSIRSITSAPESKLIRHSGIKKFSSNDERVVLAFLTFYPQAYD